MFTALVGGYFLGTSKIKETKPSTTPTIKNSPIPSPIIDERLIYENKEKGFSIKYPKEVDLQKNEDGSVSFGIWGPSQKKDTEFYDGLSIGVTVYPLNGKTLDQIVSDNIKASEEVWGIKIDPAEPITINGNTGLTYHPENHEYYYFLLKDDQYLELTDLSADPTGQGYLDIAKQILNTLSINNN